MCIYQKQSNTISKAVSFTLGLVCAYLLLLVSCANAKAQNEMTIFVDSRFNLAPSIIEKFEKAQNAKLTFVNNETQVILEDDMFKDINLDSSFLAKRRLKKIDLIISTDMFYVRKLLSQKLLGTFDNTPTLYANIKDEFKNSEDSENLQWLSIAARPKVLVYKSSQNTRFRRGELNSYLDTSTLDVGILIPSSRYENSLKAFLSFLIYRYGKNPVETWMQSIDYFREEQSIPSMGSDAKQIRLLDKEYAELALVDLYSVHAMLQSPDPYDQSIAHRLNVLVPREVFLSPILATSGKKSNRTELVINFINFLLESEIQTELSQYNYDYPAVKNARIASFLASLGSYPTLVWQSYTGDILQNEELAESLLAKYAW